MIPARISTSHTADLGFANTALMTRAITPGDIRQRAGQDVVAPSPVAALGGIGAPPKGQERDVHLLPFLDLTEPAQ